MDKKGYISRIRKDLEQGKRYTKRSIESLAKGYGIENKNLVKEYTELAIVLNAREIAHDSRLTTYEKYLDIVALYQSQVNLSMRTSMSVLMQQYSTPAPISFLASSYILKDESLSGYKAFKNIVKGSTKGKVKGNAHLTNNYSKPIYFEPSAGNGLLTIALPYHQTYVNELDDIRLENLKEQPFAKVFNTDALADFETGKYGMFFSNVKFDGIVSNPPFGSLSEPVLFGKFKIKRLEHAMCLNALRYMKDGGKAALIIGGHTSWDAHGRVTAGQNRIFLNYLYHFYKVEDVIPINGSKLYSRQGTSFNTRLILIDGAKEKPEGAAPLKNKRYSTLVNNHEELWERVGLESVEPQEPLPEYGDIYRYDDFGTSYYLYVTAPNKELDETRFSNDMGKVFKGWVYDGKNLRKYLTQKEIVEQFDFGFKEVDELAEQGYLVKNGHYAGDGAEYVKWHFWRDSMSGERAMGLYKDAKKEAKKKELIKLQTKAVLIKQKQLKVALGVLRARKDEYWTEINGDISLVKLLANGMIEWDDFQKGKVRGIRTKSELFKRKADARKYFKTVSK